MMSQTFVSTTAENKNVVLEEFTDRFGATLELGIVAMVFAISVGIPFSIA